MAVQSAPRTPVQASAAFIGASVVGLFGEIFARVFRLPATVFIVTGFLPLPPRVAATRAVIQLVSGLTRVLGQA